MSGLRFGSLFAGLGGFDVGLERAGWSCAWQVEKDDHALGVLRHHWPEVPKFDDVRTVGAAELAPVDLLAGGFPCQDLSVAGRRAGLAGERSGLFWEVCRIARELAPRWLLLENVPGLLSSNGGRDMGTVLGALGDLGYWWTYRCLDSQHFGVPQRRLRVFIVGHLGGPCPPEVLLEPASLPGHFAARGEAGERLARPLAGCTPGGSGYRLDADTADNLIALQDCRAMEKRQNGRGWSDDGRGYTLDGTGAQGVAFPLTAREGKGPNSDSDSGNTGRGTPLVPTAFNWQSGGDCRINPSETGTDALSVGQVPAVGFAMNQRREGRLQDVAGAVHEPSGTQVDGALTAMGVRRLTPVECERLQGLDDGWTAIGQRADGRTYQLADSPRYRLLGNAVTASVAEWIARRLTLAAQEAAA